MCLTHAVAIGIKNPPAKARDIRDVGSIPGSGRSLGGGHGNPLQYSYLGESHGKKSSVGYSSRGHKGLDPTEAAEQSQMIHASSLGKAAHLGRRSRGLVNGP